MKFKKTDEKFTKVLHEGYVPPTHYLAMGDKTVNNWKLDMYNCASNLFIGKRKNIESLIKKIIAHKSPSKESYGEAEFFAVTLWDKHERKEPTDMVMLATFESLDNYLIKLPLDHYINIPKDLIVLATDVNPYVSPLLALENLQTKHFENKINGQDVEAIVKTLTENIYSYIIDDFRNMDMDNNTIYKNIHQSKKAKMKK
jgi:hypothetical protein